MSKAIAFLAGLGAGYMGEEDNKRKRKIEDERLAAEREDRAYVKSERERTAADKQALRDAAAPRTVESGEVYQPAVDDEGNAMPANPTAGTYKVGAQRFAEQGLASDAAAKANDPKAVRERVASTMAAQGNVLGADQLRTSGLQGEAAQIQIDGAKRAEANALFDQGLKESLAKGPDALAEFMSTSAADGKGGEVKFKAVMLPDGKSWQMHRVGEGGQLAPVGRAFPNDEAGMATAGLLLSRSVPDKDKVAHMLQVQKADQDAAHQKGMLDVAKQNADTNEKYRRDQAENMRRQRELQEAHEKRIAEGKAKPGGAIQVDLKDMRDFESDLNGYIKDQFPVKDGATPEERAQINAQATAKKALGSALFRNNAAAGIPLTAGTVLQALELAGDRKNVRIVQLNGVPHEAVVVNGQPVVTSGPLQKREAPAPGAAPAATTPAGAAAVARGGVSAPANTTNVVASQPPAPQQAAVTPEKAAALKPMLDQLTQATSVMAAVSRSGDVAAIQRYGAQVQAARAALAQEAERQFGRAGAQEYLATLPM